MELVALSAVVFEILLVLLASATAKLIYIDLLLGSEQPLRSYISLGLVGALFILITFQLMQLYRPNIFLKDRINFTRIGTGLLIAFGLVLFQLFALHSTDVYSRGWFALWFVLSFGFIAGGRILSRAYLRQWLYQGKVNRRLVLFGSTSMLDVLAGRLAQSEVESVVVARYDVDTSHTTSGRWDELVQGILSLGRNGNCDQIVLALPPTFDPALIQKAMRNLNILPIDVLLVTHTPAELPGGGWSQLAGMPAYRLHTAPLSENEQILKGVFDKVIAGVALVMLTPLFAMIACAIRLDSPGPVFFRQRRNGYNHRVFRICKFRSMRVLDDGDSILQVTRDDDRVTRVGRVLRRTSLDELPQLYNVLVGEMSLVGPRPHALAHNEYYSTLWAEYALRHRVKPGITGLAQAAGYRGETNNPEEMRKRVELDVEYARNWSLLGDLKIMARTVLVLFKNNAY